MSASSSSSFWEKTSRFVAEHRAAVAITAAAGVSAAGVAYYILQNQSSSSSTTSSPSKKKKKKAKKTGKKESPKPDLKLLEKIVADTIFPIDKETLSPAITDELLADLSQEQKEEYAMALKTTGNDLYKAKAYEKAIEYYTAALKCKEDPVFYSNRSACYSFLENHEEVIKDTSAAIKLKPDYTKCLMRRAQSYEAIGNNEDAMFDLTAVTVYGGFNDRSTDLQLEKVLQKQSVKILEGKLMNHVPTLPTTSSISPFFGAFKPDLQLEAIAALEHEADSGSYFLAEAFKQVKLNTPEGYEAADVLIRQAAERYGKSLTAESPNAEEAAITFEYLGAFDFLKNNSDMAINNILYSIGLKPRVRAYVMLGLIYADRQEMESANQHFEYASKLSPDDADIHYHLGQLLYLSNEIIESAKHFEKAKQLNPDNVYAYIQLACCLYREGKLEESDKKFLEARSKFPTAPEIPNYYGEILSDKQDFDGAIKQFDFSVRLQKALPTFTIGAVPLVNKATLVSRTNIFELEKLLTQACELDPKSELAKMALAQAKLQVDKPEEAVKLFEALCDLSRGYNEKLQATEFAELAKMQVRLRKDPVLGPKVKELMAAAQAQAQAAGAFA